MPVIEHKVNINRSVTDIFKFVADFHNNPQWQPDSIQLQRAGQVRVGEMVVGTRRIMGRMVHVNADVVEYVPNQKIAYTGIMGSYPFRTTLKFNFASSGTEITETIDIRIMWFYFMVRPFVVRSIDGQMKTSLENLKKVMEARYK